MRLGRTWGQAARRPRAATARPCPPVRPFWPAVSALVQVVEDQHQRHGDPRARPRPANGRTAMTRPPSRTAGRAGGPHHRRVQQRVEHRAGGTACRPRPPRPGRAAPPRPRRARPLGLFIRPGLASATTRSPSARAPLDRVTGRTARPPRRSPRAPGRAAAPARPVPPGRSARSSARSPRPPGLPTLAPGPSYASAATTDELRLRAAAREPAGETAAITRSPGQPTGGPRATPGKVGHARPGACRARLAATSRPAWTGAEPDRNARSVGSTDFYDPFRTSPGPGTGTGRGTFPSPPN